MTDRLRLYAEMVHPVPAAPHETDVRAFYEQQRRASAPLPLPDTLTILGWIFKDEESARDHCAKQAKPGGPAVAAKFNTGLVSYAWMVYAVVQEK